MAYDLPFLSDHQQRRASRQIAELAREAGHIADLVSRFTANAQREAGHRAHDLADEAWQQGTIAARALGKQAIRAGKAVSKDPVPAIVAVAGLACFLSLVLAAGRASTRRG